MYAIETAGCCQDSEYRRVEEDDVLRRPQIRWDKGRKMMSDSLQDNISKELKKSGRKKTNIENYGGDR